MSHRPTVITDEIFEYITDNFSSEDDFLRELRIEAKLNKIPDIGISAEQGKFLQIYLKSIKAKYVLEIGTLAGYSAITMARALPEDGKLVTVEINALNASYSRKKAEEAGMSNKIEVVNASGIDFLNDFNPDYELDFVFLDAEKTQYMDYFEKSAKLLKKGGIIAADNALGFGEIVTTAPDREIFREIEAIRKFNLSVKERKDFDTCLLTVGDGMLMSVKLI